MQHHRGTHTGAEVGGTLREIAETIVKREMQTRIQKIVPTVCRGKGFVQRKTGVHCLDAHVVLLVNHHADTLVGR